MASGYHNTLKRTEIFLFIEYIHLEKCQKVLEENYNLSKAKNPFKNTDKI